MMKKKSVAILVCMLLFGTMLPVAGTVTNAHTKTKIHEDILDLGGTTKVMFMGRSTLINQNPLDPTIVGWYLVLGKHIFGRYHGPLSGLVHPDTCTGFIGKRFFCFVFEITV
jgi:hypothetical protein